MFRKTLALLVRALRVDARSLRPHLIRFGLLLTILWLLYIAGEVARNSGAPGLTLFYSLTMTNTWFITLVGVTYFASAITEEKEERTLGLLRMADIGSTSILLGKWLPRMVGMLSLIAVQFPFTLLSITLGGVTLAQVNAVYVALLLHLLSVGTYSLLASVFCRTTGTACRVAFIAIFLRWLIPQLAESMSSATDPLLFGRPVLETIGRLNEASVYALTSRALATTFAESPFPPAAQWWLAESLFLFGLAWLIFEPCTQGDIVSEARPSLWERWMARKQRASHRRAWPAAIAGKDFMLLAGGFRGSMLRFAIYVGIVLVILGFAVVNDGRLNHGDVGGMLLGFGFTFLALDVVQSAAKVFRIELQEQTWSALIMLPQTLTGVAWSKIAGCAIGWWPSLLMIILGGLLVPHAVAAFFDGLIEFEVFFGVAYFVMQIVLFVELTVLASISLTWAAWPLAAPLAFFAVVLGNGLLLTCLIASVPGSGNGIQAIFFFLTGASLVLAAILYRLIGLRLIDKASDGA